MCSDGQAAAPAASRSAISSWVRTSYTAAAESRIVWGRLAPGIGTTIGDLASIQARQTCCGLTSCCRATRCNAVKVVQRDAHVQRGVNRGDGAAFVGTALDRHGHGTQPDLPYLRLADLAGLHMTTSDFTVHWPARQSGRHQTHPPTSCRPTAKTAEIEQI